MNIRFTVLAVPETADTQWKEYPDGTADEAIDLELLAWCKENLEFAWYESKDGKDIRTTRLNTDGTVRRRTPLGRKL